MSIAKVLLPAGLAAAQSEIRSSCGYVTVSKTSCENVGLALAPFQVLDPVDGCQKSLLDNKQYSDILKTDTVCQLASSAIAIVRKLDNGTKDFKVRGSTTSATNCFICSSACRAMDDETGLQTLWGKSYTCESSVKSYGCGAGNPTDKCIGADNFNPTNALLVYRYCPKTCQSPPAATTLKWATSSKCKKCKPVVDCSTSSWSGYSTCSQSCGTGVQSRTRTLIQPAYGGSPCQKTPLLTQTQACNTTACPEDPEVKLGCTDKSKCNYDATATHDDGSCKVFDKCGVCGGDGSTCRSNCYTVSTAAIVAALFVTN